MKEEELAYLVKFVPVERTYLAQEEVSSPTVVVLAVEVVRSYRDQTILV